MEGAISVVPRHLPRIPYGTPKLPPASGASVPAMLSEVFAETPMDGAVTGFVLAQFGPGCKPVLWVQDRMSRREAGRPCLAGIRPGVDVLKVDAPSARDSLWTAEQGLGCSSLGGRDRGDLGRSSRRGFHGDQTPGAALGGPRRPLLAPAPVRAAQSQRRTRTLACRSTSLGPACFRPSRTGLAALAGGTVPVAFAGAWRLDSPL